MSVVRGYWVLALGVIVFALGLVPTLLFVNQTASFGWTAYAPLTSTTFTPPAAPTIWQVEIVVGLALIAGWTGYRIGRRRRAQG